MNRLETAIAYVTPQSAQIPHCHAPNGAMCRDCVHWTRDEAGNPNYGICPYFGEVNSDWSCLMHEDA